MPGEGGQNALPRHLKRRNSNKRRILDGCHPGKKMRGGEEGGGRGRGRGGRGRGGGEEGRGEEGGEEEGRMRRGVMGTVEKGSGVQR